MNNDPVRRLLSRRQVILDEAHAGARRAGDLQGHFQVEKKTAGQS